MRYRDVVARYVMRKQRDKCPLCGEVFTPERPGVLELHDADESDAMPENFRMVHAQCDPTKAKTDTIDERLERAAKMLNKGVPRPAIARELRVSERTLYRYLDRLLHEGARQAK